MVIHILTAILSHGFYQYDEQYQILEFLGFLQGKTPSIDLTWEYDKQMRGWLQPYFYYVLLKPFDLAGLLQQSTSQAIFLRLIGALLGAVSQFYLSIAFFKYLKRVGFKFKIFNEFTFLMVANLAWYLPFLHTRTSSENFAGISLAFALIYFLNEKKNHFLIGLFCGLSFLFRYQMGIVVALFWFWQWGINRETTKNLFVQAGAIILCFILGIAVDYIGYGEFSYSPWNYFYENLVLGKQAGYGHAPWWKMIEYIFLKGIPPLSLYILAAIFFFWFRKTKHFLSIITFSLFFIHILASGKHIRFLFPVSFLIPFMIMMLLEEIPLFKKRAMVLFGKVMLFLNGVLLFAMVFKLPGKDLGVLRTLNSHQNINEVYYLGEHPFIKTPGPLNFYLDKKVRFIRFNQNVTQESYYLSVDRLKDFKTYESKANCEVLYKPRFSSLLINFKKDKNRHWGLFKCSSS